MRKFKTRRLRTLWFRWLFIFAGAFALLAAFAPKANADLIRWYNMEGTATPPFPVNLESHAPALELDKTLFLDNGTPMMQFDAAHTRVAPEIPFCLPPNVAPGLTSIGFDHTAFTNLGVEIDMQSSQGIYDVTSVCFAYGSNGNGWAFVTLQMSTDAGMTFATVPGTMADTPLPATPGNFIMFTIAPGTTLNINNLVLRLLFTGGQSNGNDLQFELDNIEINGTIVPEPATVAGGFLGVLGLCWFQRRRLIRSVRFGRTSG
jgi:hypothetical protein